MNRTTLSFLQNAHLRTLASTIRSVRPFGALDPANQALYKAGVPGRDFVVVTDRTVFHPQGGGQPSDEGTMTCDATRAVFDVAMVRVNALVDGEVLHFGSFAAAGAGAGAGAGAAGEQQQPAETAAETETETETDMLFPVGESVTQAIDSAKRDLYSRYHTAGHVLGAAVRRAVGDKVPGFDELHADHFPATAACNFSGAIPGEHKEAIQRQVDEYVRGDLEVRIAWWDEDDFRARGLERLIPDRKALRMDEGEKFRVVEIVGAESYPCGGTHVDSTALCGQTNVRKIGRSKGTSRVSYVLP